jgi:hypothetical protein
VIHREHAVVDTDGVRTAKSMGLRKASSKTGQVNRRWVLTANIAADLAAWNRLLGPFKEPAGLSGHVPTGLRSLLSGDLTDHPLPLASGKTPQLHGLALEARNFSNP